MADTDNMQDYFSGLAGQGLGVTAVPNDWSPDSAWAPAQPAQVTVNRAPEGAGDTGVGGAAPAPALQAPPAPPPSGLGSLFSAMWPAPAAAAPAGVPGAAPGWQQGAIGLGLGLLRSNPFNRFGSALEGYQRGAAADVARQQLVNQYGYQQQQLGIQGAQLGLQRERLGLERELAYKPQVQFRQNEETGEWEA